MQEKSISIYIAEDDPLSGKMMTITVKRIGFKFIGLGTDTDTVIKEVGELQPDVVLMDINMPGSTDGIGAAEIISKAHNIPVIYVTANNEDSVFDRALKTAPFGYVLKPVNRENLRIVVQMGYSRHLVNTKLQEKKDELAQLNNALEAKVEARTKEIAEKNIQLEKALLKEKELNEFKSQIVTTISHEFKTPMTTIMSSAEIMESLLHKDKPKDKIFRHTNLIKSSVDELIELLNDVLLSEKFDSGKYELIKNEIELNDYFTDLLFKMDIGIGKDHQIDTDIDRHLGYANIDKKLFSQITNNILSNAFKYSDKGSTVKIQVQTDAKFLYFTVKDEGMGMNEKTLEMIYDSFYRAQNVTNIEGTGMGLSILKKSIDLLEGKISVDSKLNEGSTFKIILPLN